MLVIGVSLKGFVAGKYFKSELVDDPSDPLKKLLTVELLDAEFGFLCDYLDVGRPQVEDSRPVGVPAVFMPLDRCGYLIHRRGTSAPHQKFIT
jgi:hypothetical protein